MHDNCDCAWISVACSRCGRDVEVQPTCGLKAVLCPTCAAPAPSEDRLYTGQITALRALLR